MQKLFSSQEEIFSQKANLIEKLYLTGHIKFGEFTVKSGLKTPLYFDFRSLISYPPLMRLTAKLIVSIIKQKDLQFDLICGVPYGAIGVASSLSLMSDKPMIMQRKEAKSYGTKKLVEGNYNPRDRCLIIDDVIQFGDSLIESVNKLRSCDLEVSNAFVLLDREQGGVETVETHNLTVHSLFTACEVLELMVLNKFIKKQLYHEMKLYIKTTNYKCYSSVSSCSENSKFLSYSQRAELTNNITARKLFHIMSVKMTNLCLAIDSQDVDYLIKTADLYGYHICLLKTNFKAKSEHDVQKITKLNQIALQHNFLVFEEGQPGTNNLSQWTNVFLLNNQVDKPMALDEAVALMDIWKWQTCFLECDEFTETEQSWQKKMRVAEVFSDSVIGFLSERKISTNPKFISMTKVLSQGKRIQSIYAEMESAMVNKNVDIIVFSDALLKAVDPLKRVVNFKIIAYNGYLKRMRSEN